MVKRSGLSQQLYHHGNDLSGDTLALNQVASPREVFTSTGISKDAVERIMGRGDGIIEITVGFNDATGAAHPSLSTLPTTDVVILYAMGGTIDDPCAMLVAKQVNYDPTREPNGNLTIDTQALGQGSPLEWGVMLTAGIDTDSTATNNSSKDDAASSSNGIIAVLQLNELDYGTVTVTIEDSSDNTTFASLAAFTAVADGNEPTAQRITATGTVNRYLRIATSGTFSNADYAVGYRRGESTDDVDLS